MDSSRILAIAAALLIALQGSSQAQLASRIEKVERGLRTPVIIEGDETWTIEERMKHHKVPGLSIAVIEDFEVVWAKGYGVTGAGTGEPVTTKTLFQAGSISKPVAATVALDMVEDGKIGLNTDINGYLKSWKLPENDLTRKKKVTLSHLLSHTAGLTVHGFPGYEMGGRVPTLQQVLDGEPPANTAKVRVDLEPGTRFRYSGGGTTVVQLALEDLEDRPFPEIAWDRVLKPYGMTDSTYTQPLAGDALKRAATGHLRDGSAVSGRFHVYPEMAAAGLWTTPTDLARFAVETQLSLAGRSNKVLSKSMVERMVTPYISEMVGLGFFVQTYGNATYFGHNGADHGFTAILLAHKEKGYGAVIMINSDNFDLMPEVLRSIAATYDWEDYLRPPYKRVDLAASRLKEIAGRYRVSDDDAFVITVEGTRVFGRPLLGEPVELVSISNDTFVRRDEPSTYSIEIVPDSKTVALTIQSEEGSITAPRLFENQRLPLELVIDRRFDEAAAAYRQLKRRSPESELVTEPRFNRIGYHLLGRGDVDGAIAIFELNVEFYPSAFNTYDSLGEALMAKGERNSAIQNYKRSLELNPQNTNAIQMLKRLEAQ